MSGYVFLICLERFFGENVEKHSRKNFYFVFFYVVFAHEDIGIQGYAPMLMSLKSCFCATQIIFSEHKVLAP